MKPPQRRVPQPGLRKVSGPPKPPCRHPEHNPPNMVVLDPGTYIYACPGCLQETVFSVPQVTL